MLLDRRLLLAQERWIPNPERVTPTEMRTHLRRDDDGRQARLRLGLRRAMQHDATVDADIEALLTFAA